MIKSRVFTVQIGQKFLYSVMCIICITLFIHFIFQISYFLNTKYQKKYFNFILTTFQSNRLAREGELIPWVKGQTLRPNLLLCANKRLSSPDHVIYHTQTIKFLCAILAYVAAESVGDYIFIFIAIYTLRTKDCWKRSDAVCIIAPTQKRIKRKIFSYIYSVSYKLR